MPSRTTDDQATTDKQQLAYREAAKRRAAETLQPQPQPESWGGVARPQATTPSVLLPAPVRVQEWINEAASISGLDPRLIQTIMQKESGYNPFPPDGSMSEIGPMQLMPETVNYYNLTEQQARDPRLNVIFGAKWLRQKIDAQGGDIWRGVAAYNGAGAEAQGYGLDAYNLYHSGIGSQQGEPRLVSANQPFSAPSADPRGQRQYTVSEFANRVRSMLTDPEDRKKSDQALVEEVLKQYPQLKSRLQATSPATAGLNWWEVYNRPTYRQVGLGMKEALTAPMEAVGGLLKRSREPSGATGSWSTPSQDFMQIPQNAWQALQRAPQNLQRLMGEAYRPVGSFWTGLPSFVFPSAEQAGTPDIGQRLARGGGHLLAGEIMGQAAGESPTAAMTRVARSPLASLRAGAEYLFPRSFYEHVQNVTGAGEPPIATALRENRDRNLEALRRHDKAEADALNKYQAEMQQYRQDRIAGKRGDLDKLMKARKDWVDRQAEHNLAKREAAQIAAQEQTLNRGIEAYGNRAMQNFRDTYETGRSRLDSRWFKLREVIRTKLPGSKGAINAQTIQDVIDNAQREILVHSPAENLTLFKNITSLMKDQDPVIYGADGKPIVQDISWKDALTHHSAMGDALRGDLPGNVKAAIRYVRENGTGPELYRVAKLAGEGKTFAELNRDYAQFMDYWVDKEAVTRGGSPLEPGRQRADLQTFLGDVNGPAGARMIEDFAKYQKDGANPRLLARIREMTNQLKNLKTVTLPKELLYRGNVPVGEPEAFEPPSPSKPPPAPELKPTPPPELTRLSPRDIKDIRLGRLDRFAGQAFRPSEFSMRGPLHRPLYHLYRRWLSDPAFRERVASQPRVETYPQ